LATEPDLTPTDPTYCEVENSLSQFSPMSSTIL